MIIKYIVDVPNSNIHTLKKDSISLALVNILHVCILPLLPHLEISTFYHKYLNFVASKLRSSHHHYVESTVELSYSRDLDLQILVSYGSIILLVTDSFPNRIFEGNYFDPPFWYFPLHFEKQTV